MYDLNKETDSQLEYKSSNWTDKHILNYIENKTECALHPHKDELLMATHKEAEIMLKEILSTFPHGARISSNIYP